MHLPRDIVKRLTGQVLVCFPLDEAQPLICSISTSIFNVSVHFIQEQAKMSRRNPWVIAGCSVSQPQYPGVLQTRKPDKTGLCLLGDAHLSTDLDSHLRVPGRVALVDVAHIGPGPIYALLL